MITGNTFAWFSDTVREAQVCKCCTGSDNIASGQSVSSFCFSNVCLVVPKFLCKSNYGTITL
jgi:hypothetical protein